MKAIILAAGEGKRLKNSFPKCLLEVGGQTLLERYLNVLNREGINDLVIVLGYQQEKIKELLERKNLAARQKIRYILNKEYRRGSIVSLWLSGAEMTDDLLILDADVLFDYRLISLLLNSPKSDCFLMERDFKETGEEMKLFGRKGIIIEISKRFCSEPYDEIGEGVGFVKICRKTGKKLQRICDNYIKKGLFDLEYEETLNQLVKEADFGYEKTNGFAWIEIDFPADLRMAREIILPRLASRSADSQKH